MAKNVETTNSVVEGIDLTGSVNRAVNHKANGEKTRYSDEELEEFKVIILDKLDIAQKGYDIMKASIRHSDSNGTDDTHKVFNHLEEGAETLSKEEQGKLAQRQMKFIQHLQNALVRIENKIYGICRITGKLIPKERLRAVPHATTCADAKEWENQLPAKFKHRKN